MSPSYPHNLLRNIPPQRRSPEAAPQSDVRASEAGVAVMWTSPVSRGVRDSGADGQLRLQPGDRLTFGISCRSGVFEPESARGIGELVVEVGHWSISNLTAATTFVVENLEGGAEIVKVPARRLAMVVPFEMSRVSIPSGAGVIEIKVFGTPPTLLAADTATDAADTFIKLDVTSKYFLVLVALCEPRLRGSSMAAVPSVQEVVERLKGVEDFKDANRSSVNYHVDYLRKCKLPVEKWATYSDGGRMHSKREALVSFALRYDLVTEEHLSLLPARRMPGRQDSPESECGPGTGPADSRPRRRRPFPDHR